MRIFQALVASTWLFSVHSVAGINDGLPHLQSYAKKYRGAGILRVFKWGIDPYQEILKKEVDCPFSIRPLVANPYDDRRRYVAEFESPIHSKAFEMKFRGWGWAGDMYLPDLRGKARRYIDFSSDSDGWGATQISIFFDAEDRAFGMQLSSTSSSLPQGYIPVPGGSLPIGPQEIVDTKLTCNLY